MGETHPGAGIPHQSGSSQPENLDPDEMERISRSAPFPYFKNMGARIYV
jgi:hypothetical protein